MATEWIIDGKKAKAQALVAHLSAARAAKGQRLREVRAVVEAEHLGELEARALNKATKRRLREEEQEARKLEAELKRVGGASRKQTRELNRSILAVTSAPGTRQLTSRDIRQFDQLVHFGSASSGSALSSFHCKFTSRGLGDRRSDRSRIYKKGEAVRHLQYIIREQAREISGGGLISNISSDLGELESFFAALEELEMHDRSNANVYMSLVISLPHELSSAGRVRALEEICSLLGRQDLPHVGVLHAPDPQGDQRNFHTHIMFSLRQCDVQSKGRFAFCADKQSDLNDETFIKPFRHDVSAILNAAMERHGAVRRFTPLRNDERGLPPKGRGSGKSTPGQKHWERKQTQLERWQQERTLLAQRQLVLDKLKLTLACFANLPSFDRSKVIENYRMTVLTALQDRQASMMTTVDHHTQALHRLSAATIQTAADNLKSLSARFDRALISAQAALHDRAKRKERLLRDPARRQAIASTARRYRQADHPPIVKTQSGFAIAEPYAGQYLSEDRFEAEAIIQRVHARHWAFTLAAIRKKLETAGRCPVVAGAQGLVIEPSFLSGNLKIAYSLAYPSAEMQRLLHEMWSRWLIQEREAQEQAAAKQKARELVHAKLEKLLSETKELKPRGHWTNSVPATVQGSVSKLVDAIADGNLALQKADEGIHLRTGDVAIWQEASSISKAKVGHLILNALAAISKDETNSRHALPLGFTIAPKVEPQATTTPIEPEPEFDLSRWYRRGGPER